MATSAPTSTTAPGTIPAPTATAIATVAPGSPQRANSGSLPTETLMQILDRVGTVSIGQLLQCRVNRQWRAVVEGTNPSVPVPDDAPGVSLFPLVHRAFQLHCGACNEPRFPNTLMPYGADPFELVCRRCRFDQLLRAMRTKDRATLATLPMPFDTVYDKSQKWAVYPVRTVQLVYYACTGSREPMDPFKTAVEAKAKALGEAV
ncbi:hypothetical protein GGF32_007497 [Allomyces javanicus]|nr:hypothetical protein GGF32_007497 [Allomyces javanicus]